MKIIHFADTHIGVSNYGITNPITKLNKRVEDFLHTFDLLIDFIETNQVDLVLFAGDLFDIATPPAALIKEASQRIRDIADIATVVLVSGNHDMKMSGSQDTPLSIFTALDVDNVYSTDVPVVWELDTTGGRAVVAALPYPRTSTYLNHRYDDRDEKQETLNQAVGKKIHKLGEKARELKGTDPCFFVGHMTVNGCDFGSERVAMDFDSYTNIQQLRDGPWDYVALGHIHKHQVLSSDPPVVYAGSLDRINFGESLEDKGFTMVESVGPAFHWQFHTLPVRPMITLEYDTRDGISQAQLISNLKKDIAELPSGAIVRVIIKCNEHESIDIDLIHKLLKDVYHVARVFVDRERSTRERNIGVDSIQGMEHFELLEITLHGMNVPVSERDAIQSIFQDIEEELNAQEHT